MAIFLKSLKIAVSIHETVRRAWRLLSTRSISASNCLIIDMRVPSVVNPRNISFQNQVIASGTSLVRQISTSSSKILSALCLDFPGPYVKEKFFLKLRHLLSSLSLKMYVYNDLVTYSDWERSERKESLEFESGPSIRHWLTKPGLRPLSYLYFDRC